MADCEEGYYLLVEMLVFGSYIMDPFFVRHDQCLADNIFVQIQKIHTLLFCLLYFAPGLYYIDKLWGGEHI
jgi:hypothetical protein